MEKNDLWIFLQETAALLSLVLLVATVVTGLTATNPSTALRQRAVSQLQHSPKFGTHGFTSPDPHTIAYETWLASTVPLVGARGAIGIVLSSGKNPLQFSARSLLPDGAPKEPACQPLLSSMMTTIS